MGKIEDWNIKVSFQPEMTKPILDCCDAGVDVSLTWLEVFIGTASIVKDTENLEEIQKQFNHMLFGYSDVFQVPKPVFEDIITTFSDSELMEMIDTKNIRLSCYGKDFLLKHCLIDRSIYLNTRSRFNKLIITLKAKKGDQA